MDKVRNPVCLRLRFWLGRVLFACNLLLLPFVAGCGGASGVYGPAYVPECTCCCSNYYTPYSYHASPKATAPVSAAFLHEPSGPLANYSANHGSVKGMAKKGGHK